MESSEATARPVVEFELASAELITTVLRIGEGPGSFEVSFADGRSQRQIAVAYGA